MYCLGENSQGGILRSWGSQVHVPEALLIGHDLKLKTSKVATAKVKANVLAPYPTLPNKTSQWTEQSCTTFYQKKTSAYILLLTIGKFAGPGSRPVLFTNILYELN